MDQIYNVMSAFIKCDLLHKLFILYTDFVITNFCLAQYTLSQIYLKILVFLQNVLHPSKQNIEFSTNIATNKTAE